MNSAKLDFNKRVAEINIYFDFIKNVDLKPSALHYTELLGDAKVLVIDDELIKILKANGFILLYNLIESTVIKSVTAIFNKIIDDSLTFSDLSETVKNLWINNKTVPLKGVDEINFFKIRQLIREVAESVLATEIASLNTSCLSISGNMDAQGIRDVARQVGFDAVADGRHLVTIKQKRNQLAHGELSFCDVGKDHSVNDMLAYKDNAVQYLVDVMQSIENFITVKAYAS